MRTLSHVNGTQRKRTKHTFILVLFSPYTVHTPQENQGKRTDRAEPSVQTSVQSSRNSMDNKSERERREMRERMGNKRPRECAHFWATNVSVRSSRSTSFQAPSPATSFLRLPPLRFLPTHVSSFGALRLSRSGGERACRTNLSVLPGPAPTLQQSSESSVVRDDDL